MTLSMNGRKKANNTDSNYKPLTIMIVGYTGAGKTSLLQAVFGRGLVKEHLIGHGAPTTEDFHLFENDYYRIFDSQGLEPGRYEDKKLVERIEKHFAKARKDRNVYNHVHMLWCCIDGTRARVTRCDLRLIRELCEHVIVLLMKADITRQDQFEVLKETLQYEGVPKENILPCSVEDEEQLFAILDRTDEMAPFAIHAARQNNIKLRVLKTYWHHKRRVWSVAFSPNCRYLASGGKDNKVVLWRFNNKGKVIRELVIPTRNDVNCIRFSPDGRYLAYGDGNGYLHLHGLTREFENGSYNSKIFSDYKLEDLEISLQKPSPPYLAKYKLPHCYSIAFHPQKQWLAAATKAKFAVLLEYQSTPLKKT